MNDAFEINEYKLPSIIRNNVKIDWVNLGEGNDGDFDPENPEDENLLRFDVSRTSKDGWEAIDDGSYCTMVPATANTDQLKYLLAHFMDVIYDDVSAHGKAKRLCESLSWTTIVA